MSESSSRSTAATLQLHSGQAGNEAKEQLHARGGGKKEANSHCKCVENGLYRYEKLLDLLQSVTHPGVGLSRWSEHLDKDVQVFVQVMIFGLAALP